MLAELETIETRDMDNMGTVFLDPEQKSPRAQDFEERLTARIVGQERAVSARCCFWDPQVPEKLA